MNRVIVYGSEYGTTRAYATKFSEITHIPVIDDENMESLSEFDLVIHFGGLYAGGVKGLKKTVKAMKGDKKLIIVTVGLADPRNQENTDNIKKSISRQVPDSIFQNTQIFHLRGGIDYSKLNLVHKTMMTLLYHNAKKIPREKQTAEVKAMIETFGKQVSFVDFGTLLPVLKSVEEFI